MKKQKIKKVFSEEMKRKVTLNLPIRIRQGKYFSCNNCGKENIYRQLSLIRGKVFCSKYCSNTFKENREKKKNSMTGRKLSEETKQKLSLYTKEKSSGWKGGKPKCKDCGTIIGYGCEYCRKHYMRHRTKEHNKNLGKSISKNLKGIMPKNIMRPGKFRNIKRGYFNINGIEMFFRSKWEANYALYLDFLIKDRKIKTWGYEKERFIFHAIKSGATSYCPDFRIINIDDSLEYHEVKGWLTPRAKTQINRMRIYYPKIKLNLIDRNLYEDIRSKLSTILKFF